jgi:hypothetical protein
MADPQSPTIEFKTSALQEKAFVAFAEFVLDPARCPPPTDDRPCASDAYNLHLDELLFEVLESLFYQKLVPLSGITCPTDLILMLLWLKNDGSAVVPSRATRDCAISQYWAFTTVIHTLRLLIKNLPRYREHDSTNLLPSSDPADANSGLAENVEKYVISTSIL